MPLPITGIVGGSGASSTLLDGLVSWWEMNETTGVRYDAHTDNNTNDLSVIVDIGYATGKVGNAADFESSSTRYLYTTSPTGLEGGDRDFTFSCWIKPESVGSTTYIVEKGGGAANNSEYVAGVLADRSVAWYICSGSSYLSVATAASLISAGTWYHLVFSHEASTKTLSITIDDGTPVTNTYAGTANDVSANFYLGVYNSTTFYDGLMDEACFWARLLTSAEISEIYNSGNGVSYPG